MLLTNARVYTLDHANSVADSVLVRDGSILFVGRRGQVNPAAGEEIVDLGGRTLLPGFVDSHAHLIGLARGGMALNLSGCASIDEVTALVAGAVPNRTPGQWVTGRGWDQHRWGGGFPTAAALDRAAPETPVLLTRVDGHAAWVNNAALRAAAITRETPDPPGGRIIRDNAGAPSGVLIDRAQELVARLVPAPDDGETDAAVARAIARCLSVGLVGVQEMGVGLDTLAAYRRLIDHRSFPFRVYAAVMGRSRTTWAHYQTAGREIVPDPDSAPRPGATVADREQPANLHARLTVRAVKFIADGALGSGGAAMHEPLLNDPSNRGLMLMEPDEIEMRVREAVAAGFQPCIHAIGDRANTTVLDTYARVLAEHPGEDLRFRVEHAQLLRPSDIGRFAKLAVLPSMQPMHCTSDLAWAAERIGAERLPGAYAWRSLLDAGAIIPGGSDFPVEEPDPLQGVFAAVTRRARLGNGPAWSPEQRMTRMEAVRSFTSWAAYAAFEERVAGSIEVGKRADLVVLNGDPFTCPDDAIPSLEVARTIVGGVTVYQGAG